MEKLIIENGKYGKKLVLCEKLTESIAEYCAENNIVEMELNWAKGFKGSDLSALKKMTRLISFEICDYTITDITAIHHLSNLKTLKISTYCKTPIDLSRFSRLEELSIFWRKRVSGFDSLKNLKSLFIYKYNLPTKNLSELAGMPSLEKLSLKLPAIKSVGDIQTLQNLKFLGIYAATKLENIEGLKTLKNLKFLELESCTKIKNIEPLAELNTLEILSISNCGKVQSLGPIENLSKLIELRFSQSTNIVDGNITPLKKLSALSKIVFQNRKHYNLKMQDLRK